MRQPVTASLLHGLVVGSHAQGTTRLAVAVLIEDNERVLLSETSNSADTHNHGWELPSDLVLPGEPLTDAVYRTAATIGIQLHHVTSYLGHHDLPVGGDVVRIFVFAATTQDPSHVGRHTPGGPYRWAAIDDLPEGLDDDMLCFIHLPPVNANNPDRLEAALRGHARGLLATEAAVELLIGHRRWLRHLDFIDAYIAPGPGLANPAPMAWVDWAAAIIALGTGKLVCSSSEAQMLRIAASLADGIPLDLRDALTGLDIDNLALVARAVLHTGRR
jgi:ADP-ribose pyrophosphatase YjhB (NUDIX family)